MNFKCPSHWFYGIFSVFGVLVTLSGCAAQETRRPLAQALPVPAYPVTDTVAQSDDYHGTTVADPYRWLEDDVRESPAVRRWVDTQQTLTRGYLDQLEQPVDFAGNLEALWNYERRGVPMAAGERYFYSFNDGLMNQNQVWVTEDPRQPGRLLIDPNAWSDDGTTALASFVPSPDGRYVAYLVQEDGSDWRRARVLDVDSGEVLADDLRWLKFTGISWAADSRGFYYSRFPEPEDDVRFQSLNLNHQVYRHDLGEPQTRDALIFHDPAHPEWNYFATVSDDGAYLVIHVSTGTDDRNQVLVQDLRRDLAPRYLVRGFEQEYLFLGHREGELLFKTDLDAPLGRVIAMNARSGESREILPQQEAALQSVSAVGAHLLASYLVDAHTELRLLALDADDADLAEVALPALGSAGAVSGRLGDDRVFFAFSSFAWPPQVRQLNLDRATTTQVSASRTGVDPDDFEISQQFAISADGTRVPVFIIHRRGLELDGQNPTILYGYGGFGVSVTPNYSTPRVAWLQAGGVYAIANLRGGGEYGTPWHKAGTKLAKQNVFDDFVAAAELLIEEGYSSPARLSIMGGSNGGLLVGAVMNQRPELFAAAVPLVGVMDMLRFQKFTAGRYWVDDYGSSDDPEEFEALFAYSPYHNIRSGQAYPATLIFTADTDDRVVPGHSFKYAARLQALAAPARPALLYVESNAGHGAGTPTQKLIRRYADIWSFLWHHLRLPAQARSAAP
ncbi:MAG: prolyl oligopeptidase family serine peptidase [Pseudomonadota bacterium]